MAHIARILCPTDFSDASHRALTYAAALATSFDATLTVLHVSTVPSVSAVVAAADVLAPVYVSPDERSDLLSSMQQFVEGLAGSNVRLDLDLVEGNVLSEILDKATRSAADLIVLGTHGLSGFDRLVLGSITEKVLRKAACPILTVPPDAPNAGPEARRLIQRIMCAIDFSECSMQALAWARNFALNTGAHLLVLHVQDQLVADEASVHRPPAVGEYVAFIEKDLRKRLADAVSENDDLSSSIETIFRTGRPYKEILRAANDQKADMIVMGVRGRGALDRWMFGSTAQQVIRQAKCPVLTIRND